MADKRKREESPSPQPHRERGSLTGSGRSVEESRGGKAAPTRNPKPAPHTGNLGPMKTPPKKD